MSKIIIYEHINFQGMSKEFTSSVSNLVSENVNDCVSSLKVIGEPWVAYEHIYFEGSQYVYEEGEYATLDRNDTFSSLEKVTDDLTNPHITLYEHTNYWGRSLVFTTETNLCYGNFNDVASSHKVQRGVWVLYEHINRGGAQLVARASRDMPEYGSFNDRVSYLRPLKPGKPIITAEIQWNQKEEHVNTVVIDSLCGLNHGDHEQSFSTEMSKEYEGSVTDSFSFSNCSQISWGASFGVDVGVVKAQLNFSLSNTFTVQKGTSNTRTERKSIRVNLPAKIAPRTKLTANMVRKEVDVKVPVKLTIVTGSQSKVEYGQYRCQSGNSITTEFWEEKI